MKSAAETDSPLSFFQQGLEDFFISLGERSQ